MDKREMNLKEWVEELPPTHRARREYDSIMNAVNAFAALAEHLGCKPEDLNVDLVQWYEAMDMALNAMIDVGVLVGRHELRQALATLPHDTVDRADKE